MKRIIIFFFVASSSGQKQIMKLCILAREKNKTLGSPCIAHTQINKETDRQNEIQYALSSLSRVLSLKEWKKECAPLSLSFSLYPKHGHGIHSRSICIHRRRRYRCRCRFDWCMDGENIFLLLFCFHFFAVVTTVVIRIIMPIDV